MNCPNCDAPTHDLAFEGVYGPDIELDVCFACHVLWFDKRESIHLTPGGTLELFRVLHEHRDDPRHSLRSRMVCPRCGERLALKRDIAKSSRFSYYACPIGHGRLTPFSEFLKEKQFVRALSPIEQRKLQAEVKRVQCSSCGAPVELTKGFACEHCGATLTVLDADAVEKTLRSLSEADQERASVDPVAREARARALASMETSRIRPDDLLTALTRPRGTSLFDTDLLSLSIGFLFGDR